MARERGLDHRPRGLRRRDGAAAHAGAGQLEGRGQGADRARVSGAAADRVHRARDAGSAGDRAAASSSRTARRSWSSTARRSMPKPAARWATRRAARRGDRRDGWPWSRTPTSRRPAPWFTGCTLLAPVQEGDVVIGQGGSAAARVHHAQPHRDASAACRAAQGAGHARQAGRQRGGARRGCVSISRTTPRWIRTNWPKSSG